MQQRRRSGSPRDPCPSRPAPPSPFYFPVLVVLVVLVVLLVLSAVLLRWSMARSSAPTVSICSCVNAGRCAHTARHLRSRTRSAAEKYGSSNSSLLDSPIPASAPRSLVAVHHPLPLSSTRRHSLLVVAGNGVERAGPTTSSRDHPNGLSTLDHSRANGSHRRVGVPVGDRAGGLPKPRRDGLPATRHTRHMAPRRTSAARQPVTRPGTGVPWVRRFCRPVASTAWRPQPGAVWEEW
jgi:hypothetical protein